MRFPRADAAGSTRPRPSVELAKAAGISKPTVERAMAKPKKAKPEPKSDRYTPKPPPKPKSGKPTVGIDGARRHYLDQCAGPGVDLDAELEIVTTTLRDLAKKRGTTGTVTAGLGRVH
jgi:hypothetical protein